MIKSEMLSTIARLIKHFTGLYYVDTKLVEWVVSKGNEYALSEVNDLKFKSIATGLKESLVRINDVYENGTDEEKQDQEFIEMICNDLYVARNEFEGWICSLLLTSGGKLEPMESEDRMNKMMLIERLDFIVNNIHKAMCIHFSDRCPNCSYVFTKDEKADFDEGKKPCPKCSVNITDFTFKVEEE